MSENILITPPVVFLIILSLTGGFAYLLSFLSWRGKVEPAGFKKAYACGEDFQGHMIQPDYSQFFPFAFFFTMLHVVALVIATVPAETTKTMAIACVYVGVAVVSLLILLRK